MFVGCGDSKTSSEEAGLIEIAAPEEKQKKEVLAENKAEVKMAVEGMTCAMGCARYIEEKVEGMVGVVASTVNFDEKIATFEFDKTATSAEEIQEFISNIHDGQYKAVPVSEDSNGSEGDSESLLDDVENKDENVASVSSRINISFPELFTYFIRRIR